MTFLATILVLFCYVLMMAIVVRVVMSWFSLRENNILFNIIFQITEPILAPIRRIVPRVGIFDLTPMIAILLLQGIAYLLAIISY